jgi:hypothetical protein
MSGEGRSIYKPLTDRRIRLRIAAGRRGDPITSLLLPVSLEELPSYAALSYTWGDPKPTHSIICNGTAQESARCTPKTPLTRPAWSGPMLSAYIPVDPASNPAENLRFPTSIF